MEYCYIVRCRIIVVEIEVLLAADVRSTICLLEAYIGAGGSGNCDDRLVTHLQSIDSLRILDLCKYFIITLFPECDGDTTQCFTGIIQQGHCLAAIADMLGGDVSVVNPFSNVVVVRFAWRLSIAAFRQFIAVKAFVGDIGNRHPVLIVIRVILRSIHLNPMVIIQCKFNPDKALIGT